ncbi:hypothetical protein AXX17_AT4G38700 [Arabidopsis thaliana]|nr:hypothetical protein AXX17_AT4G38700 [Arabidopsis thaliana]
MSGEADGDEAETEKGHFVFSSWRNPGLSSGSGFPVAEKL